MRQRTAARKPEQAPDASYSVAYASDAGHAYLEDGGDPAFALCYRAFLLGGMGRELYMVIMNVCECTSM